MANSSTTNNSLLPKQFETIAVNDIRLGMFVHAIADQVGKLSVIHKGRVKHLNIIGELAASGVKTVVVDTKNTPDTVKHNTAINYTQLPSRTHGKATNIGNTGFKEASALLKRAERIYGKYTIAIQKNIKIDFSQSQLLAAEIYQSLSKTPDPLLCMSMIMDSNDYLAKHSIHAATLMCYFAQKIGMSKKECEQLTLIGFLFDIGMVKFPNSLGGDIGNVDNEENLEMQNHVQESLAILSPLKLDPQSYLTIEQHHERLDGSGYPNAYLGSKIHKFSRMLAIVDCYDTLSSIAKNKTPLSPAAALKLLSKADGGYDQKLVLQFVRCIGIYPVGSLVKLSNNCIALVTKTHKESPTTPEVNLFYSLSENNFIKPTLLDLANDSNTPSGTRKRVRVIKPVLASQYGFNMEQIVASFLSE